MNEPVLVYFEWNRDTSNNGVKYVVDILGERSADDRGVWNRDTQLPGRRGKPEAMHTHLREK